MKKKVLILLWKRLTKGENDKLRWFDYRYVKKNKKKKIKKIETVPFNLVISDIFSLIWGSAFKS